MDKEEIESKAVEIAAWTLEQTEGKKHNKKCKMKPPKCFAFVTKNSAKDKKEDEEAEHCEHEGFKEQLEEGKSSQLIRSEVVDRKVDRREAVSSKNDTEKLLVMETVKMLATSTNLDEMSLL